MSMIREITSSGIVDEALGSSFAMIFKNSPHCAISRGARSTFDRFAESAPADIGLFMVDVVHQRDLSREIEEKSDIRHESPQLILIRDASAERSISHFDINLTALNRMVEKG